MKHTKNVDMDFTSSKEKYCFEQKFSSIHLTDKRILDKEFEKCSFEECSFVECSFENCKFIDCNFCTCVFSAIKPINSSFFENKFKDSKIIGFDWTKTKSLRILEFNKCQLDYSNFSTLKLHQLKLIDCVVHEVDFTEADLTDGDFQGSDFERSTFSQTNLEKVNFKKAFNYAIDFHNNKLKKAKFSLPEAASLLNPLNIIIED